MTGLGATVEVCSTAPMLAAMFMEAAGHSSMSVPGLGAAAGARMTALVLVAMYMEAAERAAVTAATGSGAVAEMCVTVLMLQLGDVHGGSRARCGDGGGLVPQPDARLSSRPMVAPFGASGCCRHMCHDRWVW